MHATFQWLGSNSLVLLFGVVLAAVLLGKATIRGHGLGMVACAIVAGAAVSALASRHGVKLAIDSLTQSIFYGLFVYALGLRIGPSLVHALKGDNAKFTALAIGCSVLGLAGALLLAKAWDLPAGTAAGILAGSMTASAAIGAAEEAIRQGAFPLAPGRKLEDVSGMVALSFGLTYLWGVVGITLLCKFLPRWWGIDARAEAKKCEDRLGVPDLDDAGLTGYRPLAVRAHRLGNDALTGWTAKQFREKYPEFRLLNVLRVAPMRRGSIADEPVMVMGEEPMALAAAGVQSTTRLRDMGVRLGGGVLPGASYAMLGARDDLVFRQGDVLTLGASDEAAAEGAAFLGPEATDPAALHVPLDHAGILVTEAALEGTELGQLRDAEFAGQLALHHIERGGFPIPLGLHTRLQRMDVLFVAGIKGAVDRLASLAGRVARPDAPAELLTLAGGLVLGLLIGAVSFPLAGAKVGLGNAGGLLVAGVMVSVAASRLRFLGCTPGPARDLLENLGLVVFIAIVGINAGSVLATQLPGALAAKIVVAGFVVSTLPPILAWAIGHHVMKINPAVLVGAVAGARSHRAPACAAATEFGSSVPWIGFPVAYAISGILLTAFGYLAMVLSR